MKAEMDFRSLKWNTLNLNYRVKNCWKTIIGTWQMATTLCPIRKSGSLKMPNRRKSVLHGTISHLISNGKLRELSNEPEYAAAKAGDVVQSALLVEKLLKDETVQEIKNLIGDNQPILVPIQSEEASGKNRIPQSYGVCIGWKIGLASRWEHLPK